MFAPTAIVQPNARSIDFFNVSVGPGVMTKHLQHPSEVGRLRTPCQIHSSKNHREASKRGCVAKQWRHSGLRSWTPRRAAIFGIAEIAGGWITCAAKRDRPVTFLAR
jgi:hypothetical protein